MVVRIGILGYFRKAHRNVLKFPEGKGLLLINMADTCEIEHTLVPNTKGKSDLWKHFNLCKWKTSGRIDAMLHACSYVNCAVPLSDLREASQTCQCIRSATIPYYRFDHLWRTNGRRTYLSASVGVSVFYTRMDIKYRFVFYTGTQLYWLNREVIN